MELLVERKRRILRLTLNRPEKRNALTSSMCEGLVSEIEAAQSQSEVGSILISAVGHVFCAGMDLDEASRVSPDKLAKIHEKLFTLGMQSIKPIIVSVNGAALGGGLGLVTQGHIVVASAGAAFGLPEIKVGLWPFLVYRSVEAALGSRRALELSLTGRLFHTQDALTWGLVQFVCPSNEVGDRAKGLAIDLSRTSPEALNCGMQYLREAHGETWRVSGNLAQHFRKKLMETEDFREGYQAFKAKREPRWPSMPAGFYEDQQIPASRVRPEEIGTGE